MLSKGEIKRITELASCNTEFDYTNITEEERNCTTRSNHEQRIGKQH